MAKDEGRKWIERHVDVPVVSYNWDQTEGGLIAPRHATKHGLIEEWAKVIDLIRRRRSKAPSDSEMHRCCDEAIGLVRYITAAGEAGAIEGNWRPGHQILRDVAEVYEARVGRINPLVQAIIRDAMDEVYVEERFGR